ncbi:hypothetical protein I6N96_00810 [Enterococcus sp. BWM-S5]|uniref:Type IV pilus assembly protein PilM n=1 Tax=Enterococcus larvae TaxID=2794352 RepID=A0ABS4CF94_9ENTE|nr:hypothetical protein [Enterococcus larvae]MBP1044801.1 hypothetical protein [Enterococcus larvae]
MFGKKKHAAIGIDIQKNVLRYCTVKSGQFVFGEKVTNGSIFKDGKIRNPEEFIHTLQQVAAEVHMRNPEFIISVMNGKLLIRQIPLGNMKSEKEIREFLYFELGDSISLPFENPIFDLLILEQQSKKKIPKKKSRQPQEKSSRREVKIQRNRFAVNGKVPVVITSEPILEEIGYLIQRSGGQLIGVECSALAYTRVLQKRINWGQNFLLVELDSGTATITIFEQLVPVYVQYEDYNQVNWRYLEKEQSAKTEFNRSVELEELDKLGRTINNVIRYFETEISPGKELVQIYVVGGHPLLDGEVVEIIQETNDLPVKELQSPLRLANQKRLPERFLLAAGLAMKEV